MKRTVLQLMIPGLILVPALPAAVGGWTVTTVEDLPEYAVAGQPLTLTYVVRQHGVSRLSNLNGSIEATSGGLRTSVVPKPGKEEGQYVGTLTFARAGDWTITINTGFGKNASTLEPIRVIAANASAPAALSQAERGKHLFAAKGCVVCHVEAKVGPELAGRRFSPDYLKQFLADPERWNVPSPGNIRMPNLALKEREIAALVNYLNSDRQVGMR
jgi:cytochrome c551/c552